MPLLVCGPLPCAPVDELFFKLRGNVEDGVADRMSPSLWRWHENGGRSGLARGAERVGGRRCGLALLFSFGGFSLI